MQCNDGYYVHPVGPSLHLYRGTTDNSPSIYISNLLAGSTFHTNSYDVVLYSHGLGWATCYSYPDDIRCQNTDTQLPEFVAVARKMILLFVQYSLSGACCPHRYTQCLSPDVPRVHVIMQSVVVLGWCRCRLASMATCPLNFPYLLVYTLRLTKSLVALCV